MVMPQGRRKTPFSGKAKKEQLKSKKQNKGSHSETSKNRVLLKERSEDDDSSDYLKKLSTNPCGSDSSYRYVLKFRTETKQEIMRKKEEARQSLVKANPKDLEIDVGQYFPQELDFPVRPAWSYDMSKDALEVRENKYFANFVREVEEKYGSNKMNYFELNIETWRQLWRVLEISDIILIIVDIRYAALMFPPALYHYVTEIQKKRMILVLNKIDLAPTPLVAAWKNYFQEKYKQLEVVLFTTVPTYNLMGKLTDKAGLQIRRRKGRIRMAAEGTKLLHDACKRLVGDYVNLTSWENKIHEESSLDFSEDDQVEIGETIHEKQDFGYIEHEAFKNGVLSIGCVGQPNVGKSSLMNAIMGKKVVSVSRTPGHTKHFQTIFLTQNVRLCDCPGLVFPSLVPKELQVLMGSFPIAQLREPFTTIKYLGERLNLPQLLRIGHPYDDEEWSAMDICDGWAKKRGFLTAKAARLDSYRAANNLLRMSLDGKICLCLVPPEYCSKKDYWEKHSDNEIVNFVKAITIDSNVNCAGNESDLTEEDEYEAEAAGGVAPLKSNQEGSDETDDESPKNVTHPNMFSILDVS